MQKHYYHHLSIDWIVYNKRLQIVRTNGRGLSSCFDRFTALATSTNYPSFDMRKIIIWTTTIIT